MKQKCKKKEREKKERNNERKGRKKKNKEICSERWADPAKPQGCWAYSRAAH